MVLDKYIQGEEGWAAAYQKGGNRKGIWIKVVFSDGRAIYLREYSQWLDLKSEAEELDLDITNIGLRFRTHEVIIDVSGSKAVYLVRSVQAQFGGSTMHYYTTGTYDGHVVTKTRWHVPALVEDTKEDSSIEDCFEEALIYNGRKA